MRRIFHNLIQKIRRDPIGASLIVFYLLFGGSIVVAIAGRALTPIFYPPPPETPEQAELRRENRQKADEAAQRAAHEKGIRDMNEAKERAIDQKRIDELCKIIPICKKYGGVRQECAVAGDFDNCIKVRMGDAYTNLLVIGRGRCMDNGTVRNPGGPVPDGIDCLLSSLFR